MASVFITGIAGFLGANLARQFSEAGEDVSGVDIVPPGAAQRIRDLPDVLRGYIWGSLQDVGVGWSVPPVDYVVHAAAVADVPLSLRSPVYTIQQNVLGTAMLMQHLISVPSIKRVVLQSSESVYGHTAKVPILEDTPLRPVNPYGASKAAQEVIALSYHETYGLPVTVVRSSTLFGPGMRHTQAMTIFIKQALSGQPITIHGDGRQTRDFNYVDNLVEGIRLALRRGNAEGQVFNIASGHEVSVRDLAETVIDLCESRSEVIHLEQRPGEQNLRLVPSIEKARRVLGYAPRVDFIDGISRLLEDMRHEYTKIPTG